MIRWIWVYEAATESMPFQTGRRSPAFPVSPIAPRRSSQYSQFRKDGITGRKPHRAVSPFNHQFECNLQRGGRATQSREVDATIALDKPPKMWRMRGVRATGDRNERNFLHDVSTITVPFVAAMMILVALSGAVKRQHQLSAYADPNRSSAEQS